MPDSEDAADMVWTAAPARTTFYRLNDDGSVLYETDAHGSRIDSSLPVEPLKVPWWRRWLRR